MAVNRIDPETIKKQEIIYRFFRDIAHQYPPKEVLKEFKGLFFEYYSYIENQEAITAIYDLTFGRYEEAFSQTLRQSCYILIRNWVQREEYFCINELIKSFIGAKKKSGVVNTMMNRRDTWLENFVQSQDYDEMKFFIYNDQNASKIWLPFYNYFSLIAQSINIKKPLEQREAAEILAQNINHDFKFQLGRYIGDIEAKLTVSMQTENPTHLGEQVIRLLKTLVLKRDKLNYGNLANIFLQQTKSLPYNKFKNSFHNYLMFSLDKNPQIEIFRQKSFLTINSFNETQNKTAINEELITKTCEHFLTCLTTNNTNQPSELFELFVSKVNPLTLAIICLKIILLSPISRPTLDKNIAILIEYYKQKKNQDCQWFINFLDVYNVITCMYAEKDVKISIKNNELIYLVT